jgi:hypothetical protein
MAMKKKAIETKPQGASRVDIEQPVTLMVALEIAGQTPLLQNKFSQKSLEQMLRKHMGLTVQKEAKVPRECVEQATERNEGGYVCLKPTVFKMAMLSAAGLVKGLKKTNLRLQFFVRGRSIPIKCDSETGEVVFPKHGIPQMDIVRVGMHMPDIRFRPRFDNWSAKLAIEFSDQLPVQTIVDLLNRAGRGGVGEWRPQKNGEYGTFNVVRHIAGPEEIAQVEAECSSPIRPLEIPPWAIDAELTPEILKRLSEGDHDDERPLGPDVEVETKTISDEEEG